MYESYKLEALKEMDLNHLWHPFTQMKEWYQWGPLFIERGEGNYLIDTGGRRYLDGVASLWANVHGHNRVEINSAIKTQVDKISHTTLLGLTHPNAALLAGKLANMAPGNLNWVFYSECGASAVEIAIKMAYQYWHNQGIGHKKVFLCLEEGYHGDTLGAVSVGGIDLFHQIFGPLLFQSVKLPCPYKFARSYGLKGDAAVKAIVERYEEVIRICKDDVAALILEPLVQGAGGILVFPEGLLKAIKELCDRYNILMIADEVAVGFGRTGSMFACEQEGVTPDFMCLGKGITGGYLPLAATLTTDRIFNGFMGDYEEQKTFYHGHTYTGNPVACAAALASLEIFQKDQVIQGLGPKIQALAEALRELWDIPHVSDIRQKGLMAGVELMEDPQRQLSYEIGDRVGHRVAMAIRNHGVILRNLGDVMVLMPPLSITIDEIHFLVEKLGVAIGEVCGN